MIQTYSKSMVQRLLLGECLQWVLFMKRNHQL